MSTVDVEISGDSPSPLPATAADAIAAAQAYLAMVQAVNTIVTQTGLSVQVSAAAATAAMNAAISAASVISQVFSGTAGTIAAGTSYAGVTALTSSGCNLTLPLASSYQRGGRLTIADETGSCSSSNVITLTRAGSDTIAGSTTQQLQTAYKRVTLVSNGASLWTIA